MGQYACSEVTLAVDTKKYGIRIHKALFRQLGSPSQIQLLVNPEAKLVAIQPVEKGTQTGTSYCRFPDAVRKIIRAIQPIICTASSRACTRT